MGILLAPGLLFELFVALSFLAREQPKAVRATMRARFSAYGGSFLVLVFLQGAQLYQPEWFAPAANTSMLVGITLWIAGSIWTTYSVWHLRHAFSIEPQARRLVTGGPYGFARHPVYAGYFVQYAGMWLVFPTLPFALVLFAWALLMADRMQLEEGILAEAFPEYSDYRRRVGALLTVRRHRTARV